MDFCKSTCKSIKAYWGSEGAGILAIAEDTGNILVGKRSSNVREGESWGVLGGKRIPQDQDIEDTALREFCEETGFEGGIELIPILMFEDPQLFRYYTFIGLVACEFEPKCTDENEEIQWVSWDALQQLVPKHFGLEVLLDLVGDTLKRFADP
jgi:8-oxo-dGTP pyrophosphatase MutT (NUDIX family)